MAAISCRAPTPFPSPCPAASAAGARRSRGSSAVSARLGQPDNPNEQQRRRQQLNLSVLRFTFGIPGLDEAYLPRWIGAAFGSLLLLNHFAGSDSVAPAQLRSEALGVCLAGFSVMIPYLGKFLKGADKVEREALPEGNKQIFLMTENLSDEQREDLAWASYVLLKNTNTMSVLISVQSALCARGYWSPPEYESKSDILDWFIVEIQKSGLSELKETLYFAQNIDSLLWEMLPNGSVSVLIQPILQTVKTNSGPANEVLGLVVLVSNVRYAYNERDRAWIRAIAKKFTDVRTQFLV